MGKKKKNKSNNSFNVNLPRVSLCTPTFNRRPFIKQMIQNILEQKYPQSNMEWIILDDGTDPIGDLVTHIPFIKYVYSKERMNLGKKRNHMHELCSFKEDNDIIIYIDDDDYYPPERVSHCVEKLSKSDALCSGSSEIYLWFNTLDKMYKFGPYGPKHATAGTFGFKRVLLKDSHYEDSAILAEEKFFLKNYTVPFVQLDPLKTILVLSHEQNTFDKRRLIDTSSPVCNESKLTPNIFIKNKESLNFYTKTILNDLKNYEAGDVKNKPNVLEEIDRREKELIKRNKENMVEQTIYTTLPNGNKHELNKQEIIYVYKKLQNNFDKLNQSHSTLENKHKELENKYKELENKYKELENANKQVITITLPDKTQKVLTNKEIIQIIQNKTNENNELKQKLEKFMSQS